MRTSPILEISTSVGRQPGLMADSYLTVTETLVYLRNTVLTYLAYIFNSG